MGNTLSPFSPLPSSLSPEQHAIDKHKKNIIDKMKEYEGLSYSDQMDQDKDFNKYFFNEIYQLYKLLNKNETNTNIIKNIEEFLTKNSSKYQRPGFSLLLRFNLAIVMDTLEDSIKKNNLVL